MNLLRRDIKNIICEMAAQLDDDFFREGFARRKNGLVYARKIETTTQKEFCYREIQRDCEEKSVNKILL